MSILLAFGQKNKEEKVQWLTIEEASVLYEKEGNTKKMFVDLYTDWCSYCRLMEKTTMGDAGIATLINTNFIPVKLNAEKQASFVFKGFTFPLLEGQGGRTMNKFAYDIFGLAGNTAYPSIAVLDLEGHLVDIAQGYLKVEEFRPFIDRNLVTAPVSEPKPAGK